RPGGREVLPDREAAGPDRRPGREVAAGPAPPGGELRGKERGPPRRAAPTERWVGAALRGGPRRTVRARDTNTQPARPFDPDQSLLRLQVEIGVGLPARRHVTTQLGFLPLVAGGQLRRPTLRQLIGR